MGPEGAELVVLILIVLDDALRAVDQGHQKLGRIPVLILIVLDDALRGATPKTAGITCTLS